ncbi:phosphate ABC transporter permease subunit PstC [Streptomyces sp. DSM 44917]|uniref:Phosphate transport system permease protein n=1 Tax=Streptomyces boetiae TaxID=3075541 RepID=A0ABU2L1Z8_9ACTN|nr:phosphate ABC transporter permease subunit PstC [Streptomyces sp. DSM 44917]MDT0305581.1 phosphate ABC transporter permease subunit PstC [Streptomyces sp. DSM 44917]
MPSTPSASGAAGAGPVPGAPRDSGDRPGPAAGPRPTTRPGDQIFSGLSRGSGIALLVIMAAIAVFLALRAAVALGQNEGNFLTTFAWDANADPPRFGIAVLLFGTVVSSVIAMTLAVPVAVGIALFISHYAPRRLATGIGYVVDLLAAVPSIVYGLWGALYLVPRMTGLYEWLDDCFGWTGVLAYDGTPARSLMTVGLLLAIMILPIITSVTREVFRQTPRTHQEAAMALGATRWEVIRTTVLPFGRSGVISASMLGLGRALGETMAVATVLSPSFLINASLLESGGGTFAQNIASQFKEAGTTGRDALIASGLVLFLLTLVVNGIARLIIARRSEYSGANA